MHVSISRKALVLIAVGMAMASGAQAFNFGNMMNPGRWFGGDNDRRNDNYYGAPAYGYGYPGGYTVPGYGAPGYVAPGYAAPGYAAPAYGYGAPAYTAPAARTPAAPAAASKPAAVVSSDEAEIARLKERIRALETAGKSPSSTVPSAGGGAAASEQSAYSPYGKHYTFPDTESGNTGTAAQTKSGAAAGQPEYPVYSPFGPPAKFPPLQPDAEVPVESGAAATPAPAAAPAGQAPVAVDEGVAGGKTPAQVQDNQAGVVNFSPYGNPANYVPPMQDTGQRVYDLGR